MNSVIFIKLFLVSCLFCVSSVGTVEHTKYVVANYVQDPSRQLPATIAFLFSQLESRGFEHSDLYDLNTISSEMEALYNSALRNDIVTLSTFSIHKLGLLLKMILSRVEGHAVPHAEWIQIGYKPTTELKNYIIDTIRKNTPHAEFVFRYLFHLAWYAEAVKQRNYLEVAKTWGSHFTSTENIVKGDIILVSRPVENLAIAIALDASTLYFQLSSETKKQILTNKNGIDSARNNLIRVSKLSPQGVCQCQEKKADYITELKAIAFNDALNNNTIDFW